MDLDFKQIGLAAKDILFGVGAAAAGATGGPAAAEGVGKAGSGLDRILGMAGVTESRGDKFDRADFAARPQAAPPAPPPPVQQQPQQPQPASPAPLALLEGARRIAVREPTSDVPRDGGPIIGDARIAADHLRSLGWTRNKIQQILGGPENASLAAIVAKETKGIRVRGAEGVRVAQVDGTSVPVRTGRTIPGADGQAVPLVSGTRVKDV